MSTSQPSAERSPRRRRGDLTIREREIVGMLSTGMSGAEIASSLVLSPETVRTHIRNAMSKLGASTRSQAVVIALQRDLISSPAQSPRSTTTVASQGGQRARPQLDRTADPGLARMLADLCLLPDIDEAVVLLVEEDRLTLRRAAVSTSGEPAAPGPPARIALGEGPLGRVALNRRAAVLPSLTASRTGPGGALAAPIILDGGLLGVVGLATRTSRPTGQGELLVLQAFVSRIGEILGGGEDIDRRLAVTAERFGASWSATTHH